MNLNIKDFNGPLDLLLHMVKKSEYDIYEVDLQTIMDEYISFINSLDNNDLDGKSEYLIMASELIHLKSKIILGLDEEENDDNYEINSEEDLRKRLIEYEKYQNITNDFRKLEKNRQDYFTKLPESLSEYMDNNINYNNEMDVNALIKAMLEVSERLDYKKPKQTTITQKEYSIADKIKDIKSILKKEKKVEFMSLFKENSKKEIIITFLSVLEMSKDNLVRLSQSKNFSKIYLEVVDE